MQDTYFILAANKDAVKDVENYHSIYAVTMSVHWNVARGWDYNRIEMNGEVVQHANKDAVKHAENHHSVCVLTLCVH